MSTIAARAHSSASLAAPVRRPAQPRRASASLMTRIGRTIGRRPGRTFLLLAFSAVAVAILVNAMLFQKARHPAPIISMPTATTPQRQAERRPDAERRQEPAAAAVAPAAVSPAAAPLPPSRPNALAPSSREAAAPRPPAAVTSIPRTGPVAAAPAPARSAAARDPIADLINGADMRPPAEIKGMAAAKPAVPRRTVEN